jgi:hypothetical protein
MERREKPARYDPEAGTELTAARSGLVRRVNVLAGQPLVRPGQLVTEGETLVRGAVESLDGTAVTVSAKGDVMAETWYELSAVHPKTEELKTPKGLRRSRFALILGKRRLNLYFSSGKAIDGCDKIVSEYTLGQRGLFALPIRVVRETVVPCRTRETKAGFADIAARLMTRLQSGLEGQVLEHSCTAAEKDGLLMVTLRAHCMENIALARTDGS